MYVFMFSKHFSHLQEEVTRAANLYNAAVGTCGTTAVLLPEHSSLPLPKNGRKLSGLTMRTTQGVGFNLGDTIQVLIESSLP